MSEVIPLLWGLVILQAQAVLILNVIVVQVSSVTPNPELSQCNESFTQLRKFLEQCVALL